MSDKGYNGRTLIIKSGATKIAAVQSKDISHNREAVDVTTDDSSGNRTLLPTPGVRSIDISIEGVATEDNYNSFIQKWNGNTFEDITIEHPDGTEESGDFFLTSLSLNGESDGDVQFSAELHSSGEITVTNPPD